MDSDETNTHCFISMIMRGIFEGETKTKNKPEKEIKSYCNLLASCPSGKVHYALSVFLFMKTLLRKAIKKEFIGVI